MRLNTFARNGCCIAVASIVALATLQTAARAQTAPAPSATAPAAMPDSAAPSATTTLLQGTVRSGTGVPVAGANVKVSGPTTMTAQTDGSGSFSLTVPQGIYTITVSRSGYNTAVLANVVATGGTTQPVSVSLNAQDLSSLRTIGSVSSTSRGGGSAINTGAASSSFVSGQVFTDVANPQINDVLQRTPDVVLQHMGSQPDTTIVVGGVQPYETQVLIDGHPIALGQFGVYLSQYYPSYLVGGLETQVGPGNTTPFANIAVGGTVNLLTPAFTQRQTAEVTTGVDNFGSQFSDFLGSGGLGKFQYVVGAGVSGLNGPYFATNKCVVQANNNGAGDNTVGNTGVIQYCGDASGSFFNKGELAKLRYNFSPSTTFDVGFNGSWGGYSPQGSAWGSYLGATTIVPCLTSNPGQCTNPVNANLIGHTIDAYSWYLGSSVYTDQELFDAQLRTTLGNNTILVRPYLGNIEPEIITGGLSQASQPELFSPVGGVVGANPTVVTPFTTACDNAFGSFTNPAGQVVVVHGQQECFGSPYTTFEQDKLYGSTFSILHPLFNNSLLDFTYDFHGQSTFAYINSPAGVSVPFSTDRYSTFSLTSDLNVLRNADARIGLYDTQWHVVGFQLANPSDTTSTVLGGLDRSISRFDPHFAFTFRPTANVSYRASIGSSATFPYVGQVSGLATYQQPAVSLGPPFEGGGTLTEKNPNLDPEVSIGEGLGADKRFANGSVLSADVQQSVIHNVFETVVTSLAVPGGVEGIFYPVNAARLLTSSAVLRYNYAPRVGFGFFASVAATRSILNGVPLPVSGEQVPANGVQICGNGVNAPGIATCIPYLKGYGAFSYAAKDGSYLSLGAEYEGKNNAYFQPPFALVDFTFRKPVARSVELTVSVENLLNTNGFSNASYLATPNLGTPIVADTPTGSQTAFTPVGVSVIPRTVRVQLRVHTGR
jgi:hypothetical protein